LVTPKVERAVDAQGARYAPGEETLSASNDVTEAHSLVGQAPKTGFCDKLSSPK
jgi:hypothetical protein